jgi:tetratricopeptide (TPR) repeat protein
LPLLLSAFFLYSCSDTNYIEKSDFKSKAPFINKVIYMVHDNYDANTVDCIAVLPFSSNLKNEKKIFKDSELNFTEVVRRSFFAHLSPFSFEDIEIERIDYLFEEHNLDNLSAKEFLSTNYNCNYVIEGNISNFSKENLALFSNLSIGISVKLIDTKKNLIIWEASEYKKNLAGDLPLSPLNLLSGFYKSYKNTKDEKIFNLIDDISRHLIHTIPKPTFSIFNEPSKYDFNKKILLSNLNHISSLEESELQLIELFNQNPTKENYLLNLANFYYINGRYEESLNLLESNKIFFKKNDKLYFLIGRNAIKLKTYNIAKSNLIQAIRLNKKNIEYYNALGFAYSANFETNSALSAYQMALDINKINGFAHYNMAIEYYNLGKTADSVAKLIESGKSYSLEGKKDKILMVLSTLDAIQNEGIDIDEKSYKVLEAKFNEFNK